MKRRIVTIAVSFLLCIGMIGAGFAAWIITAPTSEEQTGAIVVENVSVQEMDLTFEWKDVNSDGVSDDKDSQIIFGSHATETCAWLANDSIKEKLTATLIITVNNHKELIEAGYTYNFEFALTASSDGYNTAFEAGLVGELPTITKVTAPVSTDTVPETMPYEVTVEFAWGEKFGNVNPISYYKDKDYATYATEAETNLNALHEALNGVSYNLTVNGKMEKSTN